VVSTIASKNIIMLDQSFSVKNFVKIFYDENRKGNYTEGKFFPELKPFSKDVSKINEEFKTLKTIFKIGIIKKEEYNSIKDKKNADKELLLKQKEDTLNKLLPDVTKKILSPNFKIELDEFKGADEKKIYCIKKKPEFFFAIKQLQKNIKESFNVKQADRFKILKQVEKILSDGCPKFILRTDISGFYESIPHEKLKEKLGKNLVLSQLSKKIIKNLLWEYQDKSKSQAIGVPRGVGVSAYLSELYMKDIDSKIKSLPNVTYYARYVDDIIIVFTPSNKNETTDYLTKVKEIIEKNGTGLSLNDIKTDSFDLRTGLGSYNFEFLGYRLSSNSGKNTSLNLSQNRCRKYRQRIIKTFDIYNTDSKYDEKKARKLLVQRLRFLTENIHLKNAKSNVLIGSFFSNSLLSNSADLVGLDLFLKYKINSAISPYPKVQLDIDKLKNRLREFSFVSGFQEKKYTKFTANQLTEILKIWDNIK
jgi:hypothetical protein